MIAAGRESALTVTQVIVWWEVRRILFNLALLIIGLAAILGMDVMMDRVLPGGEDAVEPIALLFSILVYGVMANVCYTLGWIVELVMRKRYPLQARQQGQRLFKLGFAGSCVLTTLPLWYGCFFWLISQPRG